MEQSSEPMRCGIAALALLLTCGTLCSTALAQVEERAQLTARDSQALRAVPAGLVFTEPVSAAENSPALREPRPIAVPYAPPAMRIDPPPTAVLNGSIWVGGYWVWSGGWVWDPGAWATAPVPGYRWVNPYYENRNGVVIFIPGYWSSPGLAFVPPAPGVRFSVELANPGGLQHLVEARGPNGIFVPPPPGSRPGIIVPAPIGTARAVVTNGPALSTSGMRITDDLNTNAQPAP